jgi:class 3 adenylate cyclase
MLQGPTTDIRKLQEMWSSVKKGKMQTETCNLYTKAGRSLTIRLECAKMVVDPVQLSYVMVLRMTNRHNPPRASKPRDSVVPTIAAFSNDHTAQAEEIKRTQPCVEGNVDERRTLNSVLDDHEDDREGVDSAPIPERHPQHSIHSPVPLDQATAASWVPRAALDSAEQEIARLRRLLTDAHLAQGPQPDDRAAAATNGEWSVAVPWSPADDEWGCAAWRDGSGAPRPGPSARGCVSVLFADVVGFTSLSASADACAVADLLARLFAALDALARRHGVTPVDVIGDAYLAATNLAATQPADHAARLARFAVAAAAAAAAIPLDPAAPGGGGRARIRVGLHCGPAAVVALASAAGAGRRTLIGDTVNTASRMESSGRPGRVQCSAAMAALLAAQAPDLRLLPRAGGAAVKGKGRMRTFWVEAPPPTPPPPLPPALASEAAGAAGATERRLRGSMMTAAESAGGGSPAAAAAAARARGVLCAVAARARLASGGGAAAVGQGGGCGGRRRSVETGAERPPSAAGAVAGVAGPRSALRRKSAYP